MVSIAPNSVAQMSYAERCNYYDHQIPRPKHSRNRDYQQYVTLIRFLGYHDCTVEFRLIGACYDYLAGPDERAVATEKVIALLSQPWRQVIEQLEGYPLVAEQLVYLQILAVWESNSEETGAHARSSVENAKRIVEECEDFLADINEERRRIQALADLEFERQSRALEWSVIHRRRARQKAISDALTRTLIFGGGLFVGWLISQGGG